MLSRRRARSIVLVLLALAVVVAIKETRWHVLPKRFAQVEPGLYRSGQMERWPYERVVREHGIRTVLRLNALPEGDRRRSVEEVILADHGIVCRAIPMNGHGTAPFDALEEAAAFVADRSRRPLLFHCAAGDRRSSAVLAAYRMKHCGWSFDEAAQELAQYGISLRRDADLLDHLRAFYEARCSGAAAALAR